MSDMLTHYASFDDCRRLAQIDGKIDPTFRELLDTQQEAARLGTLTRLSEGSRKTFLENARKNWAHRTPKDERNVAFVLGNLVHQACDKVMKPILSGTADVNWTQMQAYMRGTPGTPPVPHEAIERAHEVSAYFDAEVFREVYRGGDEVGTISRFFMNGPSVEGKLFEEFVRAAFQRALLASHTLNPTTSDMDGWMDNLFTRVQPLFVDVAHWVRVYQNPDPKKIEAYGVRTKFYRTDDPAIQAARLLQDGKPVDAKLRELALAENTSTCAYGEILQTGLQYLRNAAPFWHGETEELSSPNHMEWPISFIA